MKKRFLFCGWVALFSLSQVSASVPLSDEHRTLREKVNLFMGTANDYGQMAPGATVPFGMVQVCPDSNPRQHPGYDYEVPVISGISINRLSGVGGSGCGGNVSLMPDGEGKNIRILKATENAEPGYYETYLSNGVQVSLTATHRMAVERYAFPSTAEPVLLLNPASSFERVEGSLFSVLSDRVAKGYVASRNTCGRGVYHLYYRLYADKPFVAETQKDGRVRLAFSSRQVEVRIAVSTGLENALDALSETEVWKQDFSALKADAASQWYAILERVKVSGAPQVEPLFYTSLYRVFHSPFKVTDDKMDTYLGTDGKVHKAQGSDYYSSWSLWDTYRTKFPLITLFQPGRSQAIMASLAQLYITGKEDWSTPHECVPTVRTEHAIATLLDAYRKKVVTKDVLQKAYPGMVAEVKRLPLKSPDQCLEAASDFWALSELSKDLGKQSDCKKWKQRGEELFDSIWPREFMNIDANYTKMRGNGLYQGTRWQYRWGAPMFLDRMIALCGKDKLQKQLNTFFDEQLYNQGNEPDIHVPFLFGRLGQPLRTGKVVQELMLDSITHRYGGNDAYKTPFVGHAFKNAPRGYCPEMDEDDGTMSAWFVFASMGMYPLIVGEPVYELFSPVFDRIELQMDEAAKVKTVIRTVGRKDMRQTLRRVTWNGAALHNFQIKHAQLARGGELVFWY